MAVDPVCGSNIDEETADPTEQYTSQYGDETVYFCSADCKETFDGDPKQYIRNVA